MVWTAHINGRQHREKVLSLKKPKIEPQFAKPLSTTAIKRKAEPQNGSETLTGTSPSPSKKGVPVDFFDNNLQPPSMMTTSSKPIKSILKNSSKPSIPHQSVSDVSSTITSTTKEVDTHSAQPSVEMVPENSNSLPEGFFDDPKLDAKVIIGIYYPIFTCLTISSFFFNFQVRQIEFKGLQQNDNWKRSRSKWLNGEGLLNWNRKKKL